MPLLETAINECLDTLHTLAHCEDLFTYVEGYFETPFLKAKHSRSKDLLTLMTGLEFKAALQFCIFDRNEHPRNPGDYDISYYYIDTPHEQPLFISSDPLENNDNPDDFKLRLKVMDFRILKEIALFHQSTQEIDEQPLKFANAVLQSLLGYPATCDAYPLFDIERGRGRRASAPTLHIRSKPLIATPSLHDFFGELQKTGLLKRSCRPEYQLVNGRLVKHPELIMIILTDIEPSKLRWLSYFSTHFLMLMHLPGLFQYHMPEEWCGEQMAIVNSEVGSSEENSKEKVEPEVTASHHMTP